MSLAYAELEAAVALIPEIQDRIASLEALVEILTSDVDRIEVALRAQPRADLTPAPRTIDAGPVKATRVTESIEELQARRDRLSRAGILHCFDGAGNPVAQFASLPDGRTFALGPRWRAETLPPGAHRPDIP